MRVEIGIVYDDGRREVVQAGRPAALIAFADKYGKVAPEGTRVVEEATWLAWHALRTEQPFEEWLLGVAEIDPPRREAVLAQAGEAEAEVAPEDPTVVQQSGWPASAEVLVAPEWPRVRTHRTIATRIESSSPA